MKTIQRPYGIWLLIVTTLLISCNVFPQTKIPATWQPGMTLSMSYGGGMRYYSYKMVISDTNSFFTENVEGVVTNYKLDVTSKDLDSPLRFLNQKHFADIKIKMAGPVHDKGTESLSLAWKGNFISTGESYMMQIEEKYDDDYGAICGYIYQLRESTKRKVKNLPGQESPD